MRNLLLEDLKLALDDLFRPDEPGKPNERLKRLEQLESTAFYIKALQKRREALNALALAGSGRRPYTSELEETDELHDAYGGAFWYITTGLLLLPDLPSALRKELLELQQAFLSEGPGELKGSYADEAARAKGRQPLLGAEEPRLKHFPLPEGRSLFEVVQLFLQFGVKLDALLSLRAEVEAQQARTKAGALRAQTLKLLYNCRRALQDELGERPELPQDSERLIFGYFDELSQKRAQQGEQSEGAQARASLEAKARAALLAEQQALAAKARADEAQARAEEARLKAEEARRLLEEAKSL